MACAMNLSLIMNLEPRTGLVGMCDICVNKIIGGNFIVDCSTEIKHCTFQMNNCALVYGRVILCQRQSIYCYSITLIRH